MSQQLNRPQTSQNLGWLHSDIRGWEKQTGCLVTLINGVLGILGHMYEEECR